MSEQCFCLQENNNRTFPTSEWSILTRHRTNNLQPKEIRADLMTINFFHKNQYLVLSSVVLSPCKGYHWLTSAGTSNVKMLHFCWECYKSFANLFVQVLNIFFKSLVAMHHIYNFLLLNTKYFSWLVNTGLIYSHNITRVGTAIKWGLY